MENKNKLTDFTNNDNINTVNYTIYIDMRWQTCENAWTQSWESTGKYITYDSSVAEKFFFAAFLFYRKLHPIKKNIPQDVCR